MLHLGATFWGLKLHYFIILLRKVASMVCALSIENIALLSNLSAICLFPPLNHRKIELSAICPFPPYIIWIWFANAFMIYPGGATHYVCQSILSEIWVWCALGWNVKLLKMRLGLLEVKKATCFCGPCWLMKSSLELLVLSF